MEEIYKNLSLENLEGEIWRDVENYNGLYQISSLGRVKSFIDDKGNPREKILKQGKLKNGYLLVVIYKEGIRKNCKVHRLVATTFLDNPNNFKCVNHKNEIKTDNRVDNLEWCTVAYNNTFGSRIKKITEKLTNRQDQSKRVYQYDKDGTLVAIWESVNEAGRNGYNFGAVSQCCLGKRKSHKGYIWSYTELIC